jgi:penicillin-binding protein 1A
VAAPSFAYFYREMLKLYPSTPKQFVKPEGVKVGITADGKEEFYTDISPLQNRKIEPADPSRSSNPFDALTETNEDGIEVIKIDDEPVIDTTGRENEPINPIDLKRREPEKVGDDSGTMF